MRASPVVLLLLLAATPAAAQTLCPDPIPPPPGRHQSPVDIRGATATQLHPLATHYPAVPGKLFNTGQTVRVNVAPGDSITVDGTKFDLEEFHFHWPGEHRLMGDSFPVEIHMVHYSATRRAVALGTWVQVGTHNHSWNAIWARLPRAGADTVPVQVNVRSLFGVVDLNTERVYRYCGSLTTDGYDEGVTWLMRRTPIRMSQPQIDSLHAVMGRYSRGVQPLHGRVIRYQPH